MTRRQAVLGALLALPLALLALAAPPGARLLALASALPAALGLVVLDHVLRQRVPEATAFWTLVMAAYGTGLYALLAHAPDPLRATAFLLGALAFAILPRWSGASSVRRAAFAFVLAVGLAASASRAPGALDPGRALFGSPDGLLFGTPVLWASLAGVVLLWGRERADGRHVLAVALVPFVASPFFARMDAALPALALVLAIALDALRRQVARRPAVVLWLGLPLLAVSNLLFMQQYRDTLRRDDTVSFPAVSEGSARLIARGVGSPIAWPANWVWSARHDLPVERWDLLSGPRLDPGRGASVDVGDLEQDAAFLLEGWSVRHACGDAVCREVEGRAEMAVPLERVDAALVLRAMGPGVLRVTVNGREAGVFPLTAELRPIAVAASWRRGLNRLAFEAEPGGHVLVDGLALQGSAP